jgi:hypothetical protein
MKSSVGKKNYLSFRHDLTPSGPKFVQYIGAEIPGLLRFDRVQAKNQSITLADEGSCIRGQTTELVFQDLRNFISNQYYFISTCSYASYELLAHKVGISDCMVGP